ncbi:hypothetical protein GYB22_09170 [bacterium]|nr:hypothetical protein [bacterium]
MKSVILIVLGLMSFSAFSQEKTQITLKSSDVDTVYSTDNITIGTYRGNLLKSTEQDTVWKILDDGHYEVKYLEQIDAEHLLFIDQSKNFTYNLITEEVIQFSYKQPLEEFLEFDIEKILYSSESGGCFAPTTYCRIQLNNIEGTLTSDTQFYDQSYTIEGTTKSNETVKTRIPEQDWKNCLNALNTDPYSFPKVQYFKLDSLDKSIYLERLRLLQTSDYQFKAELPKLVDTMSQHSLEFHLMDFVPVYSTSFYNQIYYLINTNGDTLSMKLNSAPTPQHSYNIPIYCQIQDNKFYTYSIELSLLLRKINREYYYYHSHTKEQFLDYIGCYYYPNKYEHMRWHR